MVLSAFVVESFSLTPPRSNWHLKPTAPAGVNVFQGGAAATSASPLWVALRGGDTNEQQEEVLDLDAPVVPEKRSLFSGAISPAAFTSVFVALGKFYSSSLESAPIFTKSVTVSIM